MNVFRLPLLAKVREKASEGAWFASPDCRIRDSVRLLKTTCDHSPS